MKKLIVLDIVGLTKKQLDVIHPPNISKICDNGFQSVMIPSFPAVTCSVQASITSGCYPSEHGIISNGYYDRDFKQVLFWEQANSLVKKPRIWEILKKANPNLKTAVLFWQNSLFIDSDIVITPKPIHLENKMVMWCYSKPIKYYEEITKELGEFDLKWYWGPFVSIKSSQWIINATKYTIKKLSPDLVLVYLPYLDYSSQKNGPESDEFKKSLLELDETIGEFLSFLETKHENEYDIMIISEYGFTSVNRSVSPNLILRNAGLLTTRNISGKDYIDFEHSKAFAMVDHQVAHIFTQKGSQNEVATIFEQENGIAEILDKKSQHVLNIDHPKSGELIFCAEKNSWFNYYWWDDENKAPEFTFKVDIHRKPGYDPLELFLEENTGTISHNTSLIKGSHGLFQKANFKDLPIFAMSKKSDIVLDTIDVTQVAPTIAKFFGIEYNFAKKSILS